jgi:hypothetical protein
VYNILVNPVLEVKEIFMSVWDFIRRRINPAPAPRPTPTPVTPPAPPPIDPEAARIRAEAMNRRAEDGLRYKKYVNEAMSTGFLPPPPPSIDYYVSHPDYVWNPHEPNPEKPEPVTFPKADITISINGKPVDIVTLLAGTSDNTVRVVAMNNPKVIPYLVGMEVLKTEYVKDESFNIFIAKSSFTRWSEDMARYNQIRKTTPIWKTVPAPPPSAYYKSHPNYVWNPNDPTPK